MFLLIFLISFALLIFSIILHEISHGYMAERLGDPTARVMGRLTLNPIAHVDPFMTILFPLILFLSQLPLPPNQRVIFGAAKPVPIDPFNFREPRKDMGLVGLAGPTTNFVLGAIGAILIKLLFSNGVIVSLPQSFIYVILSNFIYYNFLLAAFNLLPIPPLDGSRILAAVIPEEYAKVLDSLEHFGFFILFFLLMFPVGGFSLGGIIAGLVFSWLRFFGLG